MAENKQATVLRDIMAKTTQREKMLVSTRLEMPFSDVMQNEDLVLTALAWLKRKHEKGGSDWDAILDMTDQEILELLGLADNDEEEAAEAPLEPAQPSVTTPTESGAETRPTSV